MQVIRKELKVRLLRFLGRCAQVLACVWSPLLLLDKSKDGIFITARDVLVALTALVVGFLAGQIARVVADFAEEQFRANT